MRENTLELPCKINLVNEAWKLLKQQKKEQKKSMAQLLDDIILDEPLELNVFQIEDELILPKSLKITREAHRRLKKYKKITKASMAKLASDVIIQKYGRDLP